MNERDPEEMSTVPGLWVAGGMGVRSIRRALLVALVGLMSLVASEGHAGGCDVPWVDTSYIPVVIPMSPDGSLAYTVRIVGCYGPVQASRVNVLFSPVGDSLVCWCNTSPYVPGTPHSFFANTDANGYATFHFLGGGCVEKGLAAIPGAMKFAAEVFADFIKLQECGVASPDVVDNAGRLSTDTPAWSPAGGCLSGLSDAVFHTTALAASLYSWCTDINGDHAVSLSDGVLLTPHLANATACAGNAGN